MKIGQPLLIEEIETPIGLLNIVTGNDGCLWASHWHDYKFLVDELLRRRHRGLTLLIEPHPKQSSAALALGAYFRGEVRAVEALPVLTGGTDFQKQVWAGLRDIPPGETESYSALAARIGRSSAVRAVGQANGANFIDIVIPCHRVIGANGALTGFGGGIDRKRWLLEHERKWAAASA